MNSILDNDAYKLSMANMVSRLYPNIVVRYEMINRGGTKFPIGFGDSLRYTLNMMSAMSLEAEEKKFLLRACPYLDPFFVDFFSGYRYDPHEVSISQDGGDLKIVIEGPWYRTIYWEVILMATISEQYFRFTQESAPSDSFILGRVLEKMEIIEDLGVSVADFGTRRRHSLHTHQMVVRELRDVLIGTSNLKLAMLYDIKPIGTVAHETVMVMGALYGYRMANIKSMENWIKVFKGDLGIALSDTYTTDVFLKSFDKKFAKLFDGVRQDSGDPIEQAEKIISHYDSLGIDPTTKTIVFSDSLNLDKVAKIHEWCKGKVRDSYGIGTFLTNDVGVKPLNFVIKLTAIKIDNEWKPTVKLSDSEGKHTGDEKEIILCKSVLGL